MKPRSRLSPVVGTVVVFALLLSAACVARAGHLRGGQGIEVAARRRVVETTDGQALVTYRLVMRGAPIKKPRALLLYVTGSGGGTVVRLADRLAGPLTLGIPVVASERRGVDGSAAGRSTQVGHGALRHRVADQLRVLDSYLPDFPADLPVILAGGSEGADVAAAAATAHPRVTHLVLIGGAGGWTQADELHHFVRTKGAYLGVRSSRELDEIFARIRRDPDELTMWAGHTYRRWSSFLWRSALTDLMRLKIPVLQLHGALDESVPVESARAVRDAFKRARRSNLTYREYPELDHSFRDVQRKRSGFPLVELDLIDWLGNQGLLDEEAAKHAAARVRAAHPDVFSTDE